VATISISEAEAIVMQVLWENHPQAADTIISLLINQQNWQEATVKTLLNRLLNKGAIAAVKDGRRFLYSPVLQRNEWIDSESKGFLDRMFAGKLSPLVTHFSQHQNLSAEDIANLKQLIKELDNGQ
jgi:predicted transcriptional regulator